jgi:nucleotide-binding universal stress UspA family protein
MTEVWSVPGEFWDDMDKSARTQANTAIEMAMGYFKAAENTGLKITGEVIKGNPRSAILDEAESWGADFIILGSHGYTGLKRLLLGSVSQAVASHAKCSVEIIRHPATGE